MASSAAVKALDFLPQSRPLLQVACGAAALGAPGLIVAAPKTESELGLLPLQDEIRQDRPQHLFAPAVLGRPAPDVAVIAKAATISEEQGTAELLTEEIQHRAVTEGDRYRHPEGGAGHPRPDDFRYSDAAVAVHDPCGVGGCLGRDPRRFRRDGAAGCPMLHPPPSAVAAEAEAMSRVAVAVAALLADDDATVLAHECSLVGGLMRCKQELASERPTGGVRLNSTMRRRRCNTERG